MNATVSLDAHRTIAPISPLLWGGFAEHLGRCIYGGIFEPGSPLADSNGFRTDVKQALQEIGFTVMRYPGGNFVSGYDWRDGVGPVESRPKRLDPAWQTVETNAFGTNEFITFCREIGTEPMLAVNLGTGTPETAAQFLEYCNHPGGTTLSDLRRSHGYEQPHNVKYWCLGNEMDGEWQTGFLTPDAYAKKAAEAARMMKRVDPTIQLTACGSSGLGMATFPEWDRVVLEECQRHVEFLSVHTYLGNREGTPDFLASNAMLEAQIRPLRGAIEFARAKVKGHGKYGWNNTGHKVALSWDEWNVWYRAMGMSGEWKPAPPLLEEVYNLEDALVLSAWMNLMLRNCDVIRMACLAQIVNVIGPILTRPDAMVKQTIFYPLARYFANAHGEALDLLVQSPTYTTGFGEQPVLDVAGSKDPATGQAALFLVNRSLEEPLTVTVRHTDGALPTFTERWEMSGSDPKAANTFEAPDTVLPTVRSAPQFLQGQMEIVLPPLSVTVLS